MTRSSNPGLRPLRNRRSQSLRLGVVLGGAFTTVAVMAQVKLDNSVQKMETYFDAAGEEAHRFVEADNVVSGDDLISDLVSGSALVEGLALANSAELPLLSTASGRGEGGGFGFCGAWSAKSATRSGGGGVTGGIRSRIRVRKSHTERQRLKTTVRSPSISRPRPSRRFPKRMNRHSGSPSMPT